MVLPRSPLSTASKTADLCAWPGSNCPGGCLDPPRLRSHPSTTAGWDRALCVPSFPPHSSLWGATVTCDPRRGEQGKRWRWKHTTASHPFTEPPHLPGQMCPVPATAMWPDGLSNPPAERAHRDSLQSCLKIGKSLPTPRSRGLAASGGLQHQSPPIPPRFSHTSEYQGDDPTPELGR